MSEITKKVHKLLRKYIEFSFLKILRHKEKDSTTAVHNSRDKFQLDISVNRSCRYCCEGLSVCSGTYFVHDPKLPELLNGAHVVLADSSEDEQSMFLQT